MADSTPNNDVQVEQVDQPEQTEQPEQASPDVFQITIKLPQAPFQTQITVRLIW
jgi:hypothetical protein